MKNPDDTELNAFVDHELSSQEHLEILEAMQHDKDLAQQACALSHLKSQVQAAYQNAPPAPAQNATQSRNRLSIAASGILLIVGVISGWLVGNYQNNEPNAQAAELQRFVMLDADGRGEAPAVADHDEVRIVFHLTNPDQTVAGELLDDVEQLLQTYRQDERPLRVEIVAHSEGLDLLRTRLSNHQGQIAQLANNYNNLTFVACRNTIDRLQVEQGIEVNILPAADIIRSGVDHVVKRQQEGWAYIRV